VKISGVKEFVIKTVSRGRDVVICVGKVLIFVVKRGAVSAGDFYLFLVTGLTGHLATPFEFAITGSNNVHDFFLYIKPTLAA